MYTPFRTPSAPLVAHRRRIRQELASRSDPNITTLSCLDGSQRYSTVDAFTRIRINASRRDLSQEPYKVMPLVRICAVGGE